MLSCGAGAGTGWSHVDGCVGVSHCMLGLRVWLSLSTVVVRLPLPLVDPRVVSLRSHSVACRQVGWLLNCPFSCSSLS